MVGTTGYLDAILQQRQGKLVGGVACEPKSKGWVYIFPGGQNFVLPEVGQMCVDPVLGKVTVLHYHPSTSLCRCRDRQVCRWALEGHVHLP